MSSRSIPRLILRHYSGPPCRSLSALLAGLIAIGSALPAFADPVTDRMRQAEAAYAERNFAAALTALTGAADLIRQMKAEAWKSVLPDPPPGWTAENAKIVTVGPALLGGGSSTQRRYRGPGGTVDISLIADSPMLQSVAGLLGAGILVAGSDVMNIEGQRVSYDADENVLQAIVADKVLVRVKGSEGVDRAMLEAFFRHIDLRQIEQAAQ